MKNLLPNTVMVEEALEKFLIKEIKSRNKSVPIETNISAAEFKEKYVAQNKPVVLKNILKNWPALKKWDFSYFPKNYPDLEIDVNLYDAKKYLANVLAIPFAVILNGDLLKEHAPMRYNVCLARINILSDLLGFNKDDVLGVKAIKEKKAFN